MKNYSVKTVDGNRVDFQSDKQDLKNVLRWLKETERFILVETNGAKKYINIRNIVSVTETEIETL